MICGWGCKWQDIQGKARQGKARQGKIRRRVAGTGMERKEAADYVQRIMLSRKTRPASLDERNDCLMQTDFAYIH